MRARRQTSGTPFGERRSNDRGSIEFLAFIATGTVTACGFGYLAFAAASQGYPIPAGICSLVTLFAVWCTALQSCHRG